MMHITWKNEQAASLSVVVKASIGINVVAELGQFLLRNPIPKHERLLLYNDHEKCNVYFPSHKQACSGSQLSFNTKKKQTLCQLA